MLFKCSSSGCLWWDFASMLNIWLYLWRKLWMFLKTEKKKKSTPHTHLGSTMQQPKRIAVAICIMDSTTPKNSKWERNSWIPKSHTNAEEQRDKTSVVYVWYFVELYIFTTNLTRWSFKEVKGALVLTLHYIYRKMYPWPNVAGTIRSWCVLSAFLGAFTPVFRAVCCDGHICPATLKSLLLFSLLLIEIFRKHLCLLHRLPFFPNYPNNSNQS